MQNNDKKNTVGIKKKFIGGIHVHLPFRRFGILKLQNRFMQNDVTPRVTNSKIFIEILLSSY